MFYTLFESISNIGTSNKYSLQDKRSIRLTNQSAILGLFACFIGFVFSVFTTKWSFTSAFPVIISVLFFGIFIFNSKKKHAFAKNYLMALELSAVTVINMLVDINTFTFYFFASTLILGIILFPTARARFILLILHLACVALSMYVALSLEEPFIVITSNLAFAVMNMVLIMLFSYFFISSVARENANFEKRYVVLLQSIREKNKELKEEQAKTENNAIELKNSNLALKTEVKEREKMEKALLLSNEALQEFAYVASHDLKEPLRTITSFIGLLDRKLKDKLDDSTTEYFDFIVDGAQRMSVLLDDLLTYARLNNELVFVETNLNNTIEVLSYSLKNLVERKKAKLIFDNLPTAMVSRSQIAQVFQNLISNALKFNTSETPTITVKYQETKEEHIFSIQDNGIGIAPEYQNKIFTIFNRLHDRNSYEGTGIGLAICKKIIDNHEGKIWLDSTLGVGSTFYFSISKNLKNISSDVRDLKEAVKISVPQN